MSAASPISDSGSTLRVTKANRVVYVYVSHPSFKLEPQQETILGQIQLHMPVSRHELCSILSRVMTTKSTISRILSYNTRILTRIGAIRVMEPNEFASAQVRQNDRGGYSIYFGAHDSIGIGNYSSDEDATRIMGINGYDKSVKDEIKNVANIASII